MPYVKNFFKSHSQFSLVSNHHQVKLQVFGEIIPSNFSALQMTEKLPKSCLCIQKKQRLRENVKLTKILGLIGTKADRNRNRQIKTKTEETSSCM